jgi:hypothetical protein
MQSKVYFLIILHRQSLVDYKSGYYLLKEGNVWKIMIDMIELDYEPCEDPRSKVDHTLTEEEKVSTRFLYVYCLMQAHRSGGFNGRMEFISSTEITKEEYEAVEEERNQLNERIRLQAIACKTPLIDELVGAGYHPVPSTFNAFIWTAGCKFHQGKHFMFIDTLTNSCTCPYGGGKKD